jgi:SRSO17 transposase
MTPCSWSCVPTCCQQSNATDLPKKGRTRSGSRASTAVQYCGQVGNQENCQLAVSLSVANQHASLPIAYRLYLPETWANDPERRSRVGVPDRGRAG